MIRCLLLKDLVSAEGECDNVNGISCGEGELEDGCGGRDNEILRGVGSESSCEESVEVRLEGKFAIHLGIGRVVGMGMVGGCGARCGKVKVSLLLSSSLQYLQSGGVRRFVPEELFFQVGGGRGA